jgi:hypothetical protein
VTATNAPARQSVSASTNPENHVLVLMRCLASDEAVQHDRHGYDDRSGTTPDQSRWPRRLLLDDTSERDDVHRKPVWLHKTAEAVNRDDERHGDQRSSRRTSSARLEIQPGRNCAKKGPPIMPWKMAQSSNASPRRQVATTTRPLLTRARP